MRQRSRVALAVTFAGAALAYAYWWDYLPPRTPAKVARIYSGLPVSSRVRTISFREQWSPIAGDGVVELRLQLDEKQFKAVQRAALIHGYKPTLASSRDEQTIVQKFGAPLAGWYRYCEQGQSFELVVLDSARKQLMIAAVER